MQQQTRDELNDLTYANLPDNTAGAISPAKLREVMLKLIASYLNLLDDGNPGAGPGGNTPPPARATFGNLGGNATDNTSLVTYLASLGHALTEFTPPQTTVGGQWYLTTTGIWEAKSSFNATAPPAANAYWRLVAGFAPALQASAAGRALLAAPSAVAQRQLLDIFSTTAGQYGNGQPAFTNAYRADGALVYLLGEAAYLRTQVAALNAPAPTNLTVTGFLPTTAPVGASVTLTGTGFSKPSAVFFNGTPASFQVINPFTIIATVPAGATSGAVAVTVGNATATSAARFTVSAGTTTPGGVLISRAIILSDAQALQKTSDVVANVLYAIEDTRWNGGPGATVYVHGLDTGQFAPVGYGPVAGKMVLVNVDVAAGKYTEFTSGGPGLTTIDLLDLTGAQCDKVMALTYTDCFADPADSPAWSLPGMRFDAFDPGTGVYYSYTCGRSPYIPGNINSGSGPCWKRTENL